MAAYRWVDDLTVTCRLTACTPGSAPGPTLGVEYGKPLSFLITCLEQSVSAGHLGILSTSPESTSEDLSLLTVLPMTVKCPRTMTRVVLDSSFVRLLQSVTTAAFQR